MDPSLYTPRRVPVILLQRLVGKAQSMSIAAPPVSIFLRSSYDALAAMGRYARSAHVTITQDMRDDLLCLRRLSQWSRLTRWPDDRHAVLRLATDACP